MNQKSQLGARGWVISNLLCIYIKSRTDVNPNSLWASQQYDCTPPRCLIEGGLPKLDDPQYRVVRQHSIHPTRHPTSLKHHAEQPHHNVSTDKCAIGLGVRKVSWRKRETLAIVETSRVCSFKRYMHLQRIGPGSTTNWTGSSSENSECYGASVGSVHPDLCLSYPESSFLSA